jgi:hypothetical protein
MIYSFAFDPELPTANRTRSRALQHYGSGLPKVGAGMQESRDLQRFPRYPAHEIFRHVSLRLQHQAECSLNARNGPGMNCVNNVESSAARSSCAHA